MSLDDTVQDAADRLNTPLVVLDLDLRIAAYSIHDNDVRRARLAQLLAGWNPVTEDVIRTHDLRAAARPVRIPAGDSGEAVVLALRHDKRLLGYLFYLDDRPGPQTIAADMDVLEPALPDIAMLLALHMSDLRHGVEHSKYLLSDLLHGSQRERRHAAATLVREGLIEDVEHYTVLVHRAPAHLPQSVTRLAVDATLDFIGRATTVKVVGAVLGDDGVVLFPRRVNRDRLDRVLDRPGLERVRAGVGSVQDELADAVTSYHEAQIACRAADADPKRYGRKVFWEDLGIDRLLLQLPLDRMTASQFPPGVQRLLAAAQASELAATLEGYLDSGGEIQGTARRLNIHRSTLYHRLDRIREVTGCDISDGATRLDLHAGLRVARLAGLWPQP
ncbi:MULTISPECIES: PucR family transcriptional regulator [Nocardia]|uniref:PucR family transcriptional regulator n=1 Tax=Nocardia TaxID=1817 RepID=UPI0002E5D086|nr:MULTISPECIES: helix-turn-helix domain-containing protein [Nocardia]